LWSEPAKFVSKDEWFIDKQVHAYLQKIKGVERRPNTEWFYYDGTPERRTQTSMSFEKRKV
jgi:hypothetical protein